MASVMRILLWGIAVMRSTETKAEELSQGELIKSSILWYLFSTRIRECPAEMRNCKKSLACKIPRSIQNPKTTLFLSKFFRPLGLLAVEDMADAKGTNIG